MKNLIKKLLKEDFDWITDIPSFIEITEPVAQKNPKDAFRLYWTNGFGEEYGTWSDNWYTFKNDSQGINKLTRYIKMLQNGFNVSGYFSVQKLVDLYFGGGHDYVVTDWMKSELNKTDDKESVLIEWLSEDLNDIGILTHDSYSGGNATVEAWKVTYFDENGVEFNTKINRV